MHFRSACSMALVHLPCVRAWPTRSTRRAPEAADYRRHQLDLGDRGRDGRDVHAGRLRVPRDRLLARQERRHRGREDPHELLDRRASPTGPCGFAFAFGTGDLIGHTGFFLQDFGDPQTAFPIMGLSDATDRGEVVLPVRLLRRLAGDRLGHDARAHQVRRLHHLRRHLRGRHLPDRSHWVFGGGWLQSNLGMQDFAGSTAVHLIGATGALAVLLHLGPRRGKYGPDGKPRAIPGHNMPLFGLGIFILWLGWFGFNPGSTLNALDGRFTEVVLVTQLAACAGVLTRSPRRAGGWGRSTSAWPATARSPRSSPSRRRSGYVVAVGGDLDRRGRRRDRRGRRARDRQEARRPGRRAVRARPGGHLGHARVRPVHEPRARRRTTRSATAGSSTRARSTSWASRRSASRSCSRSCSSPATSSSA